jgi:hypothetical protein
VGALHARIAHVQAAYGHARLIRGANTMYLFTIDYKTDSTD